MTNYVCMYVGMLAKIKIPRSFGILLGNTWTTILLLQAWWFHQSSKNFPSFSLLVSLSTGHCRVKVYLYRMDLDLDGSQAQHIDSDSTGPKRNLNSHFQGILIDEGNTWLILSVGCNTTIFSIHLSLNQDQKLLVQVLLRP